MSARFSYSIGDMVRIKVGPFQNFTGRIEEVDQNQATLKVMVDIFGRNQPVELRFLDVEKITLQKKNNGKEDFRLYQVAGPGGEG